MKPNKTNGLDNLIISVTQEPVLAQSTSFKKIKTPKLKLAADDLIHPNTDLTMTNKRLSEFQSISQFKIPGGQSVKNNATSYKNPFFSAFKI
jgi:hypothetical protein